MATRQSGKIERFMGNGKKRAAVWPAFMNRIKPESSGCRTSEWVWSHTFSNCTARVAVTALSLSLSGLEYAAQGIILIDVCSCHFIILASVFLCMSDFV